MATNIWVNIDGTKPLSKPMLTYCRSLAFIWGLSYKGYHSHKSPHNSLKITYLKFCSNLPGATSSTVLYFQATIAAISLSCVLSLFQGTGMAGFKLDNIWTCTIEYLKHHDISIVFIGALISCGINGLLWLIILVLNVVIVIKLAQHRSTSMARTGPNSALDKGEVMATRCLLTLSVIFTVLIIPEFVYVVKYTLNGDSNNMFVNLGQDQTKVTATITTLYCSMNFVLYLASGRAFRMHCIDTFKRLFLCRS